MEVLGENNNSSPWKWCQGCSCFSPASSSLRSKVSVSSTTVNAALSDLPGGVSQILVPEGKRIFHARSNRKKAEVAVLISDNVDSNSKMETEKQQGGRNGGLWEVFLWWSRLTSHRLLTLGCFLREKKWSYWSHLHQLNLYANSNERRFFYFCKCEPAVWILLF